MKKFSTNSGIAVLIAVAVFGFFTIIPSSVDAGYTDRSDELPGMNDFPTELAIIAGVAVVASVVYLVSKSGSDDNNDKTDDNNETEKSESGSIDNSLGDLATNKIEGKKLNLYLGMDKANGAKLNTLGLSDIEFKAGVVFSF